MLCWLKEEISTCLSQNHISKRVPGERGRKKLTFAELFSMSLNYRQRPFSPLPYALHTHTHKLFTFDTYTYKLNKISKSRVDVFNEAKCDWDLYWYYYDPRDLAHVVWVRDTFCLLAVDLFYSWQVCANVYSIYRPCVRLVSWPIYLSSDGFLIYCSGFSFFFTSYFVPFSFFSLWVGLSFLYSLVAINTASQRWM